MLPNKDCIACKGTGKVFVERLKYTRKCVCTFLTKEEIEEILSSKFLFIYHLDLSYEVAAGVLLVEHLINKESNPNNIDELDICTKAGYYNDSLWYMLQKRKVSFDSEEIILPEIPEEKLEAEEMDTTIKDPEIEKLEKMDTPIEAESDEETENTYIETEIHHNAECINCNAVRRKMLKVGTLFFCLKCAKVAFKTNNPLLEEKAIVRAWLNYNQDLLLGMQDPIKPNTRSKKKSP